LECGGLTPLCFDSVKIGFVMKGAGTMNDPALTFRINATSFLRRTGCFVALNFLVGVFFSLLFIWECRAQWKFPESVDIVLIPLAWLVSFQAASFFALRHAFPNGTDALLATCAAIVLAFMLWYVMFCKLGPQFDPHWDPLWAPTPE
jgi:hypothetical protein